jgi:hypothetical protein
MLKQFSLPQKIFGTTTLLLGMCYVGFLIYVQPAFAAKPIWLWYDAQVWNIHNVSGDTWRNHTYHHVRYDNTANNSNRDVEIRAIAKWVKNDNQSWASDDDTWETCLAGAIGTIFISRQLDQHITGLPDMWKAQAYTNLVSKNAWHDGQRYVGATFTQTEERTRPNFPPSHPRISARVENLDQP